MKLSDVSVKRPVFAAVLAMLTVVVGIVGFFSLSIREYPDVDPPVVSVDTVYTGAAASVVESRITQVLEERLSGIEGLEKIGRASCRERVCTYVSISGVAVSLQKQTKKNTN